MNKTCAYVEQNPNQTLSRIKTSGIEPLRPKMCDFLAASSMDEYFSYVTRKNYQLDVCC